MRSPIGTRVQISNNIKLPEKKKTTYTNGDALGLWLSKVQNKMPWLIGGNNLWRKRYTVVTTLVILFNPILEF